MVGHAKLLQGKWTLVTGASRGIGKAIAMAFAEEGSSLWLTARSETQLEETAQQCKAMGAEDVVVVQADLTEKKVVDELARLVADRIDVLVNDAGIVDRASVLEGNPDLWEKMIQLDLVTPMRLTRHLAPIMAKKDSGGRIINITSILGLQAVKGTAAYNAAKFGMTGWSKSTFEELKEHNVLVTAIYPGFVASDMTKDFPVPHDKMIRPEDIAEAALLPFRLSAMACPTDIVIRATSPLVPL